MDQKACSKRARIWLVLVPPEFVTLSAALRRMNHEFDFQTGWIQAVAQPSPSLSTGSRTFVRIIFTNSRSCCLWRSFSWSTLASVHSLMKTLAGFWSEYREDLDAQSAYCDQPTARTLLKLVLGDAHNQPFCSNRKTGNNLPVKCNIDDSVLNKLRTYLMLQNLSKSTDFW